MPRKRILLADESLTVLKTLENKGKSAGCDISAEADSSEALEEAGNIHRTW